MVQTHLCIQKLLRGVCKLTLSVFSTVFNPFIASNPRHHQLHHSMLSIHVYMCSQRLTIRFSAACCVWLCSPDRPGLSQARASVLAAPYTQKFGCLLTLTTQCHSILHSRMMYNTSIVVDVENLTDVIKYCSNGRLHDF